MERKLVDLLVLLITTLTIINVIILDVPTILDALMILINGIIIALYAEDRK